MKKLLLSKKDIKPSREDFEVLGVFNPGCIKFGNETLLLLRVAERPKQSAEDSVSFPLLNTATGEVTVKALRRDDKRYNFDDPRVIVGADRSFLTSMSHLRLARSTDGVRFTVDDKATVMPEGLYEEYGIEDPRITELDGVYNICYSCASQYGILVGLIQTTDFVTFTRKGYMFHPDNKDVAIFPRKVNGRYLALHRPSTSEFGQRNMWLAESSDLLCWGNHKVVITPREGCFDSSRVGAGCVPFLTDKGWIELYHGADDGNVYAMGALLLDRDDPSKVLRRTERPIVLPAEDFETQGFFGNVVFGCGCIYANERVELYYGASDEYVAKATLSLDEIYRALQIL